MTFLLDTDTCISFLRQRDSIVQRHLAAVDYHSIVLCSIVKAELYYGAQRSSNPDHGLQILTEFFANFTSLPFDDRCAETYGHIRAHLSHQGTPIGPNDLLIAAIAIAHGGILVTHNTREFSRVPDLQLEDWDKE
ncbi:MAG: type II toxin-antitoxin system VapC family toxin [Anaerolineae bacterium]